MNLMMKYNKIINIFFFFHLSSFMSIAILITLKTKMISVVKILKTLKTVLFLYLNLMFFNKRIQ